MGVIVARYLGQTRSEFWDGLDPGQSADFHAETDYAPGDYDEFDVRLEGQLLDIPLEFVEGNLDIVEGSLSLTTGVFGFTEYPVFYGEIVNNTNAVITEIVVSVDLMDARGNVIGSASSSDFVLGFVSLLGSVVLQPGEKIEFGALSRVVSIGRIEAWEAKTSFKPIEIISPDIPTVSTGMTWGQIKQGRKQ